MDLTVLKMPYWSELTCAALTQPQGTLAIDYNNIREQETITFDVDNV